MQQKINEPSMVSFNINSLHSTFQYVVDWNGWKHPDVLWRILFKLTDPLYETPVPDTYTTQVNSNLKYLLDLVNANITKSGTTITALAAITLGHSVP